MAGTELKNGRFALEQGWRVTVQIPHDCEHTLLDHVLSSVELRYGDYNAVTFTTAPGRQHYRSLGSGRNRDTGSRVEVKVVELSFFVATPDELNQVLEAIYATHPYEEPVIYLDQVTRALHVRGMDEDNPHRFWNSPAANDWVPAALRLETRTAASGSNPIDN